MINKEIIKSSNICIDSTVNLSDHECKLCSVFVDLTSNYIAQILLPIRFMLILCKF